MTNILLPTTHQFCVRRFDIRMAGAVQAVQSVFTGAIQTAEQLGDQWHIRLEYGFHMADERALVEAFFNRFRGMAHVLQCWHLRRPRPLTFTGPATVATNASAQATTIVVTGFGTLKPGDMLGLSLAGGKTQLVQVHTATGTNTMTCGITPPLRGPVASGSTVVLERPTADFLITEAPFMGYERNVGAGFAIEAVEFFG